MSERYHEVQQTYLNNEKAILKELEKAYKDALNQINKKLEILMARQDADMAHVIYQIEYQKALKTQVQSILEELQTKEFESITEYLAEAYEDGFIGTMYDLQGQGIDMLLPIDQKEIVSAIQHETMLSSSLYKELGIDISKLQKTISGEISRGLATGMVYSDIARNISSLSNAPKNRAMTIARTEANRIHNTAAFNAGKKAQEKGADLVKRWDAIMDMRTRPTHRMLHGQIREVDEPFQVIGKKAMFPHQFGRPEEDINCRCDVTFVARWALDDVGALDARWDFVDEQASYEAYKKQYKEDLKQLRKEKRESAL